MEQQGFGIGMSCLSVPKIIPWGNTCAFSRSIVSEFSYRFYICSRAMKTNVHLSTFVFLFDEIHCFSLSAVFLGSCFQRLMVQFSSIFRATISLQCSRAFDVVCCMRPVFTPDDFYAVHIFQVFLVTVSKRILPQPVRPPVLTE